METSERQMVSRSCLCCPQLTFDLGRFGMGSSAGNLEQHEGDSMRSVALPVPAMILQ